MVADQPEQDPALPRGWFAWSVSPGHWVARPPGIPNPVTYVYGESKEAVARKAWEVSRHD